MMQRFDYALAWLWCWGCFPRST